MIAGFGADMVAMPELARLLADRASAFAGETFTAREIAYARSAVSRNELSHLAARYAAKEATIKAFGSAGVNDAPISLAEIEVVHASGGAPSLSFSGRAATLAASLGIARAWLSMSHDGEYALASVILER